VIALADRNDLLLTDVGLVLSEPFAMDQLARRAQLLLDGT
jgi:hypothetical protein